MKLIIVESPTKAKTLSRFLGNDFVVKSSYGHIRDLPKSEMGVDIEHNFTPKYVVGGKSRAVAADLKKTAAKADIIYFASDEDREGEAISWHLAEILKPPQKKAKRIVFHEITKEAILEAIKNPRAIDMKLVDAQQARRVLDRLVGYELSPLLWRKVAKGLSAGRVQSVAVRLIVDREREIQAFKPQEYWSIEALMKTLKHNNMVTFLAKLHKIDNKVLEKFAIPNQQEADKIVKNLQGADYTVEKIEKKQSIRNPLPPFTTSTLQQEANHRLGFSAKQTMMFAQQLYEGIDSEGLITYMRTDSVTLSDKFLNEARAIISKSYGKDYLPSAPRQFTTKSKLAQEAHEAIRPTEASRSPENIKQQLNEDQWKLYDLIWRRAVASQMKEAVIDSTTVDVAATIHNPSSPPLTLRGGNRFVSPPLGGGTRGGAAPYTFRATGSVIKFDGFLKVWPTNSKEEILPQLTQGEKLDCEKVAPKQHFTEPPPRYSDATLVKIMEEYGIGRPSTYAPTISTIIERNYVERIEGRRLKPTDIGIVVNDLLVKHFPQIVDYQFTAKMEDDLDQIAEGKIEWVPVISEFYGPFKQNLTNKYNEIIKKDIMTEPSNEKCDKCGKPMVVRLGRYGKFLGCSGFPECRNIVSLDTKSESGYKPVPCPKCHPTGDHPKGGGGEIVEKRSKRGKIFYACNQYPACDLAFWNPPTGEKCPDCGALLVIKGKNNDVACSNKECGATNAKAIGRANP